MPSASTINNCRADGADVTGAALNSTCYVLWLRCYTPFRHETAARGTAPKTNGEPFVRHSRPMRVYGRICLCATFAAARAMLLLNGWRNSSVAPHTRISGVDAPRSCTSQTTTPPLPAASAHGRTHTLPGFCGPSRLPYACFLRLRTLAGPPSRLPAHIRRYAIPLPHPHFTARATSSCLRWRVPHHSTSGSNDFYRTRVRQRARLDCAYAIYARCVRTHAYNTTTL